MTTPIQLPAVLFNGKAREEESTAPASLLTCCTNAIPTAGTVTVKLRPLLARPPTVTTTEAFPVAIGGTSTDMLVGLQALAGAAAAPLKVTVLDPCVAPKPDPEMVTDVPTGPDMLLKLEMSGRTEKGAPLLAPPPTVTTTFPDVAPDGTDTPMLVGLQ